MVFYKLAETRHLVLEAKWYDMINAGIKKEEYRYGRIYDLMYQRWQKYDTITFHRGYTKVTCEFVLDGMSPYHEGKPEWGAPEDVDYYTIFLGKRVR